MNSYNTLGANSCGEAAQEAPVYSGINTLEFEQGITHENLASLLQRLAPVLRPEAPVTDKPGPQAVRASHSPLHQRINERTDSQESINRRLRDIIERLTV